MRKDTMERRIRMLETKVAHLQAMEEQILNRLGQILRTDDLLGKRNWTPDTP